MRSVCSTPLCAQEACVCLGGLLWQDISVSRRVLMGTSLLSVALQFSLVLGMNNILQVYNATLRQEGQTALC